MRSGQFKAGDKLPSERELMRVMNVGRSTVREALQALAAMSLVDTHSGAGSTVRALPPLVFESTCGISVAAALERDTALQLLEIRQAVEEVVAGWAIERATEADCAALKQGLDRYLQSTSARDWSGTWEGNQAFHVNVQILVVGEERASGERSE